VTNKKVSWYINIDSFKRKVEIQSSCCKSIKGNSRFFLKHGKSEITICLQKKKLALLRNRAIFNRLNRQGASKLRSVISEHVQSCRLARAYEASRPLSALISRKTANQPFFCRGKGIFFGHFSTHCPKFSIKGNGATLLGRTWLSKIPHDKVHLKLKFVSKRIESQASSSWEFTSLFSRLGYASSSSADMDEELWRVLVPTFPTGSWLSKITRRLMEDEDSRIFSGYVLKIAFILFWRSLGDGLGSELSLSVRGFHNSWKFVYPP